MNARLQPRTGPHLRARAMLASDADAVAAIEARAYSFPWTRGNFIDSLAAGYAAQLLHADDQLVGYFIAMPGVDELHLLNITVAPAEQGQGYGSLLLDQVQALARQLSLPRLLLEVRGSNERARGLYLRRGFQDVGLRRGYYPAAQGREDALVMSLQLDLVTGEPHGLV
jgi:[ribosomal protein S18]-alanine N-acetyltransferase